ncbi:hypothetical protein HYW35_02205 [Candidatus Saccharibacteria bacterium]|nr:hypothetical protein [Candidatus Saccharibacteria bacterium]
MSRGDIVRIINGRLARRLALVGLLTLIVLITIFVATHGRLSIPDIANWDKVTIQKGEEASAKETLIRKNPQIVRSGKLIITFTKGSDIYRYHLESSGWLKTTSFKPSLARQAKAQKIANNTRLLHAEAKGVIYTMNEGSQQTTVELHRNLPNIPFVQNSLHILPAPFSPMVVYDNKYIGTQTSLIGPVAAIYDPVTNNIRSLSNNTSAGELFILVGSADKSGLVYFDSKDFYYLKDTEANPVKLDVKSDSYSFGDNGPIASFTGKNLYLYKGPISSVEEASSEIPAKRKGKSSNNLAITPFNAVSNQEGPAINFKVNDLAINYMTASPDNEKIGLVTNKGSLRIYNIVSKKLVTDFVVKRPTKFFWQNNNTLLTFDVNKGVERLDIKNESSSMVFSNAILDYEGLEKNGDTLFVTTRANSGQGGQTFAVSPLLDLNLILYKIDLSQPADNQAVLGNLPYVASDYTLDVLGDKVYFVATTGDIKDPLFANPGLQSKEVEKRIDEAKIYLKSKNIPSDNVVFLKDLRLNLNFFWGKDS